MGRSPSPVGLRTKTFSLVVPLFNEQERFTEKAPELAEFMASYPAGSELIFVDDGSQDGTPDLVEEFSNRVTAMRIRLIRRQHAGKGAAVRAGLAVATGEYAGFCDVDLSTPLSELKEILRTAAMRPVLAIGSRDVAASRLLRPQGPLREWLGKAYNRLIQLTVAPGISDTQCGAKVAPLWIWQQILPWCNQEGFAWDVEAIAVARQLGIPVREVAIAWQHDVRSRVHVARDGTRMVFAVPKIARSVGRVPAAARAAGAPSEVFDAAQAATLIESDTDHWWFRCKGAAVATAIRRYLPATLRDAPLLDVGAGAGGVTTILGWRPERSISVDGSFTLCQRARERHSLLAVTAVGQQLPFPERAAGVVTLLDVIEHLDRPQATLREVRRAMKADGVLIVNVPAHPKLWSKADELLGHVRRYTRPTLRSELLEAGFDVVWMSHIFSWLVPPVWIRRRLATEEQAQLGLDMNSTLVDRTALVLARLERMIAFRLPLPVGTSILCVSRAHADPQHPSSSTAKPHARAYAG